LNKPKRDAKVTQQKIIKEARRLFSLNGFDATTIDDIAKYSGVNKALIYYYFQNKHGLYTKIMSDLFDSIYDTVVKEQKKCKSSMDELEKFILTYAKYAYKNRYFPALLLREFSNNGVHLSDALFANMKKLYVLLSDILTKGEKQKVFKPSIPMVIHFMIIGTLNLMVATKPLRVKATETDGIDTCLDCSADEISAYVFQTIKKSLEVK